MFELYDINEYLFSKILLGLNIKITSLALKKITNLKMNRQLLCFYHLKCNQFKSVENI